MVKCIGKYTEVCPHGSTDGFVIDVFFPKTHGLAGKDWENPPRKAQVTCFWMLYLYVPGSKLPLFPYNRGWSSTQ